jgi:hypothetical protein
MVLRSRLNDAAHAVHRVLVAKRLEHVFFGGYELQTLGCPRFTKDIDVVVKKPLLNGFSKVKQVFLDNSQFCVFDGKRTDNIRAIYLPSNVGVDIMLQ